MPLEDLFLQIHEIKPKCFSPFFSSILGVLGGTRSKALSLYQDSRQSLLRASLSIYCLNILISIHIYLPFFNRIQPNKSLNPFIASMKHWRWYHLHWSLMPCKSGKPSLLLKISTFMEGTLLHNNGVFNPKFLKALKFSLGMVPSGLSCSMNLLQMLMSE